MNTPVYNTIGIGYNTTRTADPYLTERIIANLQPKAEGLYLDIGCGTGNYLAAISNKGFRFYGIDPADTMMDIARKKCNDVTFINATAESIPLADNFFDGVTATLTLHHWGDRQKGLTELHRVMKPGARIVFFSFTPQQMYGYWLNHYFPEMIDWCARNIPTLDDMRHMFATAGFTTVLQEPYAIREDLQDHFLYAHKHRPEQYLRQEIRDGISAFRLACSDEELQHGLNMLQDDINTGKIDEVIKSYKNDLGDYLFYTAIK